MVAPIQEGQILHLECAVQNYAWGIRGVQSLAGRVYEQNSGESLSADKPYAELWMGTHPNGPSLVKRADGSREALRSVLGKDLPFLFKILSVGQALSIQAHPDRPLAERLHADFPHIYRDPNHKPEIAVALTQFEALCGFRPAEEIVGLAGAYPEFAALVSVEALTGLEAAAQQGCEAAKRSALKSFFRDLMNCDAELVRARTEHLLDRLGQTAPNGLESLFIRLNEEYPREIGCFCIFVMNYVTMDPGECIFMAASEPHAYLRGECVECMALSDNVVRAGLTPKFRDVETLCGMLTYNTYKGEEVFTRPESVGKHSMLYKAPVDEFAVIRTQLTGTGDFELVRRGSETVLLCLSGSVVIRSASGMCDASVGNILVLPPDQDYELQCTDADGALLFQAFQP